MVSNAITHISCTPTAYVKINNTNPRTPLHCAAAYRNQEMMEYLLCQGASLYLTTKDGDTPLNIIMEDYKTVKGEEKDVDQNSKSSQLLACLNYLSG